MACCCLPAVDARPSGSDAVQSTPLIIGLPSLIELGHMERGPMCSRFWVRAATSRPQAVYLSTAGMSGARLTVASKANQLAACDYNAATVALRLVLPADQPFPVALLLPEDAFPSAAAGMKGRLLVQAGDAQVVEVPITLREKELGAFIRAASWFFGIFIPALLASGLGLIVYRTQKAIDVRAKDREILLELRKDGDQRIKEFFTRTYPAALALEPDASWKIMDHELFTRGILSGLPLSLRNQLMAAMQLRDRKALKAVLAKAFPAYGSEIHQQIRPEASR